MGGSIGMIHWQYDVIWAHMGSKIKFEDRHFWGLCAKIHIAKRLTQLIGWHACAPHRIHLVLPASSHQLPKQHLRTRLLLQMTTLSNKNEHCRSFLLYAQNFWGDVIYSFSFIIVPVDGTPQVFTCGFINLCDYEQPEGIFIIRSNPPGTATVFPIIFHNISSNNPHKDEVENVIFSCPHSLTTSSIQFTQNIFFYSLRSPIFFISSAQIPF